MVGAGGHGQLGGLGQWWMHEQVKVACYHRARFKAGAGAAHTP